MTTIEAAFDLLGVPPDSEPELVTAAWRALVRSYHPSMARTDPEGANRKLAEINAAFDAVRVATFRNRSRKNKSAVNEPTGGANATQAAQAQFVQQRGGRGQPAQTQISDPNSRGAAYPVPSNAARMISPVRIVEESSPFRLEASSSNDSCPPVLLTRKATAAFAAAQNMLAGPQRTRNYSVYF
jgi:curved DNA-binding protein CbpA